MSVQQLATEPHDPSTSLGAGRRGFLVRLIQATYAVETEVLSVKWFLLTVFAVILLIIGANAVVLLGTFGPAELIKPPIVFLVGIFGAGIALMLALGRWVILRERAEFGWRLIAGRRPQEPMLAQAWLTGVIIFATLCIMSFLIIVFALTVP